MNALIKTHFIATLLPLALLAGCAKQSAATHLSNDAEIVNGTVVAADDAIAKSTAFVFSWNQKTGMVHMCSSSLIAKDLIVTAAHCVVDDKGVRYDADYTTYVLFATSFNIKAANIADGAIAIPSAQIISNPNYKQLPAGGLDDVALIKLPQDAPADRVPVTVLQDASVLLQPNTSVTIAGYGLFTLDGAIEKTTGVYILRRMTTFLEQPYADLPTLVPVAGWTKLIAAEGDSGGPGFVVVNGQTLLFGALNGTSDRDALYTNLAIEMPWIKATAAMLKSSASF